MANEPMITVVGNAAGDAEMRFLPSGAACCSWNLAHTPRVKQGDSWVDGETVWYRCTAWRQLGESAVESITKGMRLIVHGRLKVRTYEHNGEKRTAVELDVEDVGADMRYAVVKANKVTRDRQPAVPVGGNGNTDDPWGGQDDQPPF